MERRTLGVSGPESSVLGLGCMGMSGMYGPADRAESIATIHAALEAGVTLLDTGDFYGMGHNELLIREALTGRNRDRVRAAGRLRACNYGRCHRPFSISLADTSMPRYITGYNAEASDERHVSETRDQELSGSPDRARFSPLRGAGP
jgi:diketogulonate reductase-like aldo/keto reductase